MNYQVFLFVGCSLIAIIIMFRLFVLFNPDILQIFDDASTLLLMMTYVLVSLIVLTSFVGKNLKTIEFGNNIDIKDYFGDVVGLIFWPIGIWTFQPRVNKLAHRLASSTIE